MKKLLLLLAMAMAVSPLLQAQCVIDTTTNDVVTPPPGSRVDSINEIIVFPVAQVGQPYSSVLQFMIPADTGGVPIDYVAIDSIVGLPPGMSYSCNPDSCYFMGGDRGCVEVSGTSSAPDSMQLVVYLELKTTSLPNPAHTALASDYEFYFVVRGQPSSLGERMLNKPRAFPNPAQDLLQLELGQGYQQDVKVQLVNMLGKVVKSFHYSQASGALQLPVSDLKPGLYLYSISSGKTSYSGRFTISR